MRVLCFLVSCALFFPLFFIALEEIQAILRYMKKNILANFTSAQDRRTLNTAYCCLNSLRIRVEAHVNSVEQSVIQRQLSLVQNLEHCRPRTSDTQEVPRSDSGTYQRYYLEHPVHQPSPASEPDKCKGGPHRVSKKYADFRHQK